MMKGREVGGKPRLQCFHGKHKWGRIESMDHLPQSGEEIYTHKVGFNFYCRFFPGHHSLGSKHHLSLNCLAVMLR